MSKAPSTFRQRDVTAAIRAMEAAGHEVERVEIGRDGKIVVFSKRSPEEGDPNEWEGATL